MFTLQLNNCNLVLDILVYMNFTRADCFSICYNRKKKDQTKLRQHVAVKTCFLIAKWLSYREVIDILIKLQYNMPTYLCNKHVHDMNFCWWPVVRPSIDGHPTPKMSHDCRRIVDRSTADGLPIPTSDLLCLFVMWMRVVARFGIVGPRKSAD